MTLSIRKCAALSVFAAFLTLGIAVFTQTATATHIRPNAARPVVVPLVVAYNQCTSATPPGQQHNPTNIAQFACSPQTKSSNWITSGDPVVNGAMPQFKGQLKYGAPSGVTMPSGSPSASYIQDIRCGTNYSGSPPPCSATGSANGATPADYTGMLVAVTSMRITDHDNGQPGGPWGTSGTVQQLSLEVPFNCSLTTSTTIGSECLPAVTNLDALCGCVAAKRMNIELGRIVVRDGNLDGNPFNTTDGPNTDVAQMGVFVP